MLNPGKKFLELPRRWKIILIVTALFLFVIPLASTGFFYYKAKNCHQSAEQLLKEGNYLKALQNYQCANTYWPTEKSKKEVAVANNLLISNLKYQSGLVIFKKAQTKEDFEKAKGYFQKVIKEDKNYKNAQTKIAECDTKINAIIEEEKKKAVVVTNQSSEADVANSDNETETTTESSGCNPICYEGSQDFIDFMKASVDFIRKVSPDKYYTDVIKYIHLIRFDPNAGEGWNTYGETDCHGTMSFSKYDFWTPENFSGTILHETAHHFTEKGWCTIAAHEQMTKEYESGWTNTKLRYINNSFSINETPAYFSAGTNLTFNVHVKDSSIQAIVYEIKKGDGGFEGLKKITIPADGNFTLNYTFSTSGTYTLFIQAIDPNIQPDPNTGYAMVPKIFGKELSQFFYVY